MNKMKLLLIFLLLLPNVIFAQDLVLNTYVKTNTEEIKIPGNWEELNKVEDSGQTYLKNNEGVIISVAQNPKKNYSFFNKNVSDFENIKLFYTWDSNYYIENNYETNKIKENSELEYIIWKFNDKKLDNIFLFGSIKNNFLNILVYTKIWSEEEQILFLENIYKLNK